MSLGAAKAAMLGAASAGGGAAGTAYRYLRVVVDGGFSGSGHSAGFGELEFYQADTTKFPSPDMTSNTVPSPLVASTQDALIDAWRVYSAADLNSVNIPSYATGHWYQVDLGSELFVAAGGHALLHEKVANSGSGQTRQILASNTGAFAGEEAVLWTGSQAIVQGVIRQLDFIL